MLFKILIFIAVLFAIYIIFFKNRVKNRNTDKEIENFVECKKCGTFIEAKNAVISGGGYVCRECIKG